MIATTAITLKAWLRENTRVELVAVRMQPPGVEAKETKSPKAEQSNKPKKQSEPMGESLGKRNASAEEGVRQSAQNSMSTKSL